MRPGWGVEGESGNRRSVLDLTFICSVALDRAFFSLDSFSPSVH